MPQGPRPNGLPPNTDLEEDVSCFRGAAVPSGSWTESSTLGRGRRQKLKLVVNLSRGLLSLPNRLNPHAGRRSATETPRRARQPSQPWPKQMQIAWSATAQEPPHDDLWESAQRLYQL